MYVIKMKYKKKYLNMHGCTLFMFLCKIINIYEPFAYIS